MESFAQGARGCVEIIGSVAGDYEEDAGKKIALGIDAEEVGVFAKSPVESDDLFLLRKGGEAAEALVIPEAGEGGDVGGELDDKAFAPGKVDIVAGFGVHLGEEGSFGLGESENKGLAGKIGGSLAEAKLGS